MIYTIGNYEDSIFETDEPPTKLGRYFGYPGGSVWRTFKEAESHLKEGYEVYGVEADWEIMTEPSDRGNWHDLLIDSPLIKLQDLKEGVVT